MPEKKKLLIVESPAKAKTIGKYLGSEFVVKSSVGHIRDLPRENNAIRITPVGENHWTFEPTYIVSEGKEKVVAELKSAVKGSSEIYLASDPDREGEAIAWHLQNVLAETAAGKPFRRVTYNEITKSAVLKAVAEPRAVDLPLVDAQQARRILDRLVGYKVSPLLWKNISCPNNRTLSAGRVQSVALRLLVERQREIDAFKPETFYLMGAEAKKRPEGPAFIAKLARFDGEKPSVTARAAADNILLDLAGAELEVTDLKAQPKARHALPPFTTSTLQQAASSVLGFSPGATMKLAQELYEQGRITYMRTDSVNVSDQARAAAKDFIVANYGAAFYPATPNFFKSKADAQGAHEAIRPTDVTRTPETSGLDARALKLYDLVWRRFVASQMADAKTTLRTASLEPVKPALAHKYLFTASATEVDFEGFLRVMKLSLKKKTKDGEDDEDSDEVAKLPPLAVGETLDVVRWIADEKQTKGPSHYSEASLIKALEENGVGRPSTYAATIETLKTREYAKTEKKKLVPLERGILVCDWLVKNLDALFSVGYTAEMEAELDKVAEHGEPMDDMLSAFYAKFMKSLKDAEPPPPDTLKFDAVFELLDAVKVWKEPKTVGKRTYDDKAFVESVREQREKGERPLSARQLEFLVRMVSAYADQIPNAFGRLKELGFSGSAVLTREMADPILVRYCFEHLDKLEGFYKNSFFKSLHDQYERSKPLSMRQFSILARAMLEHLATFADAEQIRTRLASYAPEEKPDAAAAPVEEDPKTAAMLKLAENIREWRPVTGHGRNVYDDKGFIASLNDQFARRHVLSPRQISALRRVLNVYKDQIPDFEKAAKELNLIDPRASRARAGKKATGEKPA